MDKNEQINNNQQKSQPVVQDENNVKNSILLYLHDLVCLLSGIVLVLLMLFRIVIVSGASMNSTLIDGDYLLLLSNVFYTQPEAGDVIVATKEDFKNGEPIIKRVIATEGQKVDIDFVAGVVYVDDVALDEPYTLTPTNLEEGVAFPLVVEDNCIFVMGDNRNMSKDSRSLEIGQIDIRQVLGKAILIIFPGNDKGNTEREFSRMGALPS